jgi:hypothetical protein
MPSIVVIISKLNELNRQLVCLSWSMWLAKMAPIMVSIKRRALLRCLISSCFRSPLLFQ